MTEDDKPASSDLVPRNPEGVAFAFASRGVRATAVRLPPSVHGQDGGGGFRAGFVSVLAETARAKGVSAYIGDGQNLWSTVHRLDAAKLFCLALEKGLAGSVYHAVGEEGIAMKDIAATLGQNMNLPVVSKSLQEAPEHFGWFANLASINAPASSNKTREVLGWRPSQIELFADLKNNREKF